MYFLDFDTCTYNKKQFDITCKILKLHLIFIKTVKTTSVIFPVFYFLLDFARFTMCLQGRRKVWKSGVGGGGRVEM